jgi:hypothetical protein
MKAQSRPPLRSDAATHPAGGDRAASLGRRFWLAVRDRYFTLDLRLLGIFRIAFGALLLADVFERMRYASLFFSDDGVLPMSTLRAFPMATPSLSLFHVLNTPTEVRLGMGLTALVYAGYMVGFRTRGMQVLSLLFYVSLNNRNLFLENGGSVVVILVLTWTVFLPLGSRFSLDARRTSVDSRSLPTRHVTLVALALLLQIAVIYFFNAAQKTGATWSNGEAVHWVLWQNRIATPLSGWLRMHEPAWFSPLATKGTLLVEGIAPVLVLTPFLHREARILHVVLTLALHVGIALLLDFGMFSYAMLLLNMLVLPPEFADRVGRFVRPPVAKTRDAGSPGDFMPAPSFTGRAIAFREASVCVLLVAFVLEVLQDNPGLPARFRAEQWKGFRPGIEALRLHQGWAMFAPDAPKIDGTIVVDGVTVEGAHLDPFTGKAPDFDAPLHGPQSLDYFLSHYFVKISYEQNKKYRTALQHYLARWQRVTARGEVERLESFEVYWVSHEFPPPGSATLGKIERRLLLSSR